MPLGILYSGAQVTHRPYVCHNLSSVPHISEHPKAELWVLPEAPAHWGPREILLVSVYECRINQPIVLISLENPNLKGLIGGVKSEFYAVPGCSTESSGKGISAFLTHVFISRIILTQKYISSLDSLLEIMRFRYLSVFREISLLLLTISSSTNTSQVA